MLGGSVEETLDQLLDGSLEDLPGTAVGDNTFSSATPTTPAPKEVMPFSAMENKNSTPVIANRTGENTKETYRKIGSSNTRYRAPTSSAQSKAASSRSRDQRLPSSKSSSVFDRLYKTQTASSAASRSWAPVRSQVRKGGGNVTIKCSKPSSTSVDDQLHIFSRLHITGTVANSSKRIENKHAPSTRIAAGTPKKGISSASRSPQGVGSPFSPKTPVRTGGGNLVYSPRMKPKTKLLFCSKHHPGNETQDVSPITLGYSFFQAFCAYENGELEAKNLAKEVVQAFFRKDFPQGRHWNLQEPAIQNLATEPKSFHVKMSAIYDCEGSYKVATAQGTVRCLKMEVRVENYTYVVN